MNEGELVPLRRASGGVPVRGEPAPSAGGGAGERQRGPQVLHLQLRHQPVYGWSRPDGDAGYVSRVVHSGGPVVRPHGFSPSLSACPFPTLLIVFNAIIYPV